MQLSLGFTDSRVWQRCAIKRPGRTVEAVGPALREGDAILRSGPEP